MGDPNRSIFGHSLEWQQAYLTSRPEDSAQRALVDQLALPISASQTREQAKRVDALRARIALTEKRTAERMYDRLTSRSDSLGNLFYLTLHPTTIKSLIGELDAKRHEIDRGATPDKRGTEDNGTQNRRIPPPKPDPTKEKKKQPPPPPPPPPPPWSTSYDPFPVPPPWESDPNIPPSSDDPNSPNWVWSTLSTAAGVLGMTISVGLRAVSSATMEKAIEAAWLVFQITEAEPAALIGMAGEAAAEAFLADILGVDPSSVRNLNDLTSNFPVVDLISPRWLASVKTRGVLSVLPPSALTDSLRSQYTSDLLGIITGEKKVEDAAEALLRNKTRLGRAWPSDLRATTVDGVAKYIREKSLLMVPTDHVQPLKRTLGEDLYRRLSGSKKALDQLGIKDNKQLVAFINKQTDRIESMGPSSADFRLLAETAHNLPPKVNEKFREKHAPILRKQKKLGK